MLRRIPKLKKSQSVIIRIDANSDYRLQRVAPFLLKIRKSVSRVVLISHFGDPKGRRSLGLSLASTAERLAELLREPVEFVKRIDGVSAKKVREMRGFVLLENTRFYEGEELNDLQFARLLSEFGDIFINEAFSVCHRKHASVHGITRYMPSFAGDLLKEEIAALSGPFTSPLAIVLGGIKLSTKLPLLLAFEKKADLLIIGSGSALPFFRAKGIPAHLPGTAKASIEDEEMAEEILRKYHGRILLPEDVRVKGSWFYRRKDVSSLRAGDGPIYDIGRKTTALYADALKNMQTIIWNGPLGMCEVPAGAGATIRLAKAIGITRANSIVGGGDTLDCFEREGLLSNFRTVSTGGGAMLAYLAGEKLPGITALES